MGRRERAAPARVAGGPVPGPAGWPILGSFVPFARDPLGFCDRVAAEWGDLARFRLLDHTLWMLSHPDDIEQVLVKDARKLHKDAIYDLMRPIVGDGLVTAEGEAWRRHRKLAAPSFTPRHVAIYADTMVRLAAAWRDARSAGQPMDLHHEMMELTQRIVVETLFGTDLDVDTGRVGEAIDRLMLDFASEAHGLRRLIPRSVPTPGRRRGRAAIARLDATIFELIAARRRRGLGEDLLSHLLQARDEEGGLSDQELRDEAVTAFVAGHETTALALTWTFVLLGEHPVALEPVRAELAEVLGDRRATAADLPRLRATAALADESLRLWPPVWAIGREAREPIEVRGHSIPVGDQILLCQWTVHHDPRWFPDPLAFRPGRWLDGSTAGLPRCAFFPFGGGPRVCIGEHFARMELILVLATLLQGGVPRTTGPRPRMLPSITLRPVGPVPASWSP